MSCPKGDTPGNNIIIEHNACRQPIEFPQDNWPATPVLKCTATSVALLFMSLNFYR